MDVVDIVLYRIDYAAPQLTALLGRKEKAICVRLRHGNENILEKSETDS
jgi:hypothetical protein